MMGNMIVSTGEFHELWSITALYCLEVISLTRSNAVGNTKMIDKSFCKFMNMAEEVYAGKANSYPE